MNIKSDAFQIWLRYYKMRFINDKMRILIKIHKELIKITPPEYLDYRTQLRITPSWIRSVRESTFLTLKTVSSRMNIGANALAQMEQQEISGAISLKNLKRAAEALDCELVYGLVPKNGKTPAEEIWDAIYPYASQMRVMKNKSSQQQMHAIASAARSIMESPEFRTKMGWSSRGRVSDSGIFRKFSRMDARKLMGIKKVFIEM